MKTLQMRIAEDFAAGSEITSNLVKNKYSATQDESLVALKYLRRVYAVSNSGKKDHHCTIYIVQNNAVELVAKEEERCKKFWSKAKRNGKLSGKDMMATHNPLIVMFDKLLAEVRNV